MIPRVRSWALRALAILAVSPVMGAAVEPFAPRLGQIVGGIGKLSLAAPVPKVFCKMGNEEPFGYNHRVTLWNDVGDELVLPFDRTMLARWSAPYAYRNVYGASLSFPKRLPPATTAAVITYGFCGAGALRSTTGVSPSFGPVHRIQIASTPRAGSTRVAPAPGGPVSSLKARAAAFLRAQHLAVARSAIGAFLAIHYLQMVPYAAALYGRDGLLPTAALNPAFPFAPTPLAYWDSAVAVTATTAFLTFVAIAYAVGCFTRSAALLLWLGSYALFHRNELTLNPSLPFLGLWLLAQGFTPAAPPGSVDRWWAQRRGVMVEWSALPRDVWNLLWWVSALAYAYSAVTKLVSPSWWSGHALTLLLTSPLARSHALVGVVSALPAPWLAICTYSVIAMELLYLPLSAFRRLRPWLWVVLVGLHLGLLATLDLADISLAMIVFHLGTFDPRWLPRYNRLGGIKNAYEHRRASRTLV